MSFRRALPLAVLGLLLSAPCAQAATHTWTGANSSLWSDPGNWTGGTPLGDLNAVLVFPSGATTLTSTDDLPGVTYSAEIDIDAGYTLDASPGSSLALAGDVVWTATSGTSTISIPIALYQGVVHAIRIGPLSSSGTLVLSGPMSGASPDGLRIGSSNIGSLITVVLSGASPFSGPVSVYYGTLQLDGSVAGSVNVQGSWAATLTGSGSIGGDLGTGGNTAVIRPGSPTATGILSVAGNFFMGGGTLYVRLNGTTPGSGYDQLMVGGGIQTQCLGFGQHDNIDVSLGFVPPVGTVFAVVQGAGPVNNTCIAGTWNVGCIAVQVANTSTAITVTRVSGGPSVNSVSISSTGGQTVCSNGTAGTATATDSGGCSENTNQWGYRSVSGGTITAIPGQTGTSYLISGVDFPGTGTFYLVETTTGPAGDSKTSNELTITVPSTTGTASAPTTICAGQPAQLHATGGPTCSWSPATDLSDPNSCDPVASPSTTTTYTVSFSGLCAAANQPSVTLTVLPLPATKFYTLMPCRAVDTRWPDASLGGPKLAAGAARTFVLAGACGVPSTAQSIAANVTIASPSNLGDLRISPANLAVPAATTINFYAYQNRANNAMLALPCDGSGAVDVLNESTQPVDLILDVVGYFE